MANLVNDSDGESWLADNVVLDLHATKASVGDFGTIYGLTFDLLPSWGQISRIHRDNGGKRRLFPCYVFGFWVEVSFPKVHFGSLK